MAEGWRSSPVLVRAQAARQRGEPEKIAAASWPSPVGGVWLALAMLACLWPAYAGNGPQPPAPANPDPALLEFLGSWQGPDGHWVDPMMFAELDPDKLKEQTVPQDGKPLPPRHRPAGNTADGNGGGV